MHDADFQAELAIVEPDKYPLPEGIEDIVVNREELSQGLRVTTPTIDAFRKLGMPVLSTGSNGKSYEFQLSACWAWVQKRKALKQQKTDIKKTILHQLALELVGGELDEEEFLTPRQKRELYETELAFMKAAEERGDLIRRSEVAELISVLLQIYRNAICAMPDRLGRVCGLKPDQIAVAATACDEMLIDAVAHIKEKFGGNPDETGSTELLEREG